MKKKNQKQIDQITINEQIKAKQIRLIDENGEQVGVVDYKHAINKARSLGLDLVLVTDMEIPVCKIVDAGKFLFQKKKQEKEIAKRQRELQVDIKEIQVRPVTSEADLMVKVRRADDFLSQGDKVKLSIRFRGREIVNKDEGYKVVDSFLEKVSEYKVDRPLMDKGKEWSLVLAPIKTKSEIIKEKNIDNKRKDKVE